MKQRHFKTFKKFERIFHEQMYSAINVEGSSADKRKTPDGNSDLHEETKNADNNG